MQPKQKAPAAPGLSNLSMMSWRSVLGDDRLRPVELVVHADHPGFDGQARPDDVRSTDSRRSGNEIDVLAAEVHVIEFAKDRPAGGEHPLEAATNRPTLAIDAQRVLRQERHRNGADEGVILPGPGAATLHVTEELGNEQEADTGGCGKDILGLVLRDERADREAGERGRNDVRIVD